MDHTKLILRAVLCGFLLVLLATTIVAKAAVRFAVIGDFGDGSPAEASVAGMVSGWNPDFIITTGDNRYSLDFDTAVGQFYCEFIADAVSGSFCSGVDSAINAFFPCLGNHDYQDGGGLNEYLAYFSLPGSGLTTSNTSNSERYYDFVKGPLHFFVIDSQRARSNNADRNAQRAWLQAQLASSATQWQIVYFHHPPYSSGTANPRLQMQWPFASWGAEIVIAGHDHIYERIAADGITYFVNGLGGASISGLFTPVSGSQVRYNDDHGAMLVNASDTAITFEFISLTDGVVDTYTLGNEIPTAGFSADCTNLDCTFTDTSTDIGGSVVAWSWDFGDGTSSTLQNPSHSFAAGSYTVNLLVTDNEGATDSTSQIVTVSAPNVAPTAGFSANCTDLDCTFTDSSTDTDGSVVAWSWDFGDGTSSTLQNPSHSFAAGSYTVNLLVTDNEGATDSTSQIVTVSAPNVAPTAGFSANCTDLDCTFTDSSTDTDGSVVAWSWDFGDGTSSTLQNPSHSFAAGSYTVNLLVTDNEGATDSTSQIVTVSAPNVAPTAGFSANCTNLDCTFTDSSTDTDGSVVAWLWDFGDGASSTLQNPSHSFAAAGSYTVNLLVTDNAGGMDSTIQILNVDVAVIIAGDVNSDGLVNAADLLIANQILMGSRVPTMAELEILDVAPLLNGVPVPDGEFNLGDYLVLLRMVQGL